MMEFFCLTPFPGSEGHQTLYRKGVAMDPDMNKYDTEHVVTAHPKMTHGMGEIYRAAWEAYYTPEHLERILHRAGATGINLSSLAGTLLHFSQFTAVENVHPLQGGIFRLKFRRDRRSTLEIEPIWAFYPKYLCGTARKLVRVARGGHLYRLAKTSRPTLGRRPTWIGR